MGGAANVAGKAALDLAGGQVARSLGKGAGYLVGPAAKGIVAGLKHAGAWDAVAKTGYPEAAARVLRARLGMSPEQAQRAVQAVEASGEKLKWKPQEAGAVANAEGRKGVRSVWTTTEGKRLPMNKAPWEYGNQYLDIHGNPQPLGENVAGITDHRGKITIDRNLQRNLEDVRVAVGQENKVIPVQRHESVHWWLTPKMPENQFLQRLVSPEWIERRALRGVRSYNDNSYVKFLEEAAAQTYGVRSLSKGLTYPLKYRYMTPEELLRDAAKYHGTVGLGMAGGYGLGRLGADLFYGHESSSPLAAGGSPTSGRHIGKDVKEGRRPNSRAEGQVRKKSSEKAP